MTDTTGTTPASSRAFPTSFLWGTATASYQIEGGAHEGGRGRSIWDDFSETPGRVLNGDTGAVACDHYHRWEEDLDLLADLGVGAYRLSIAWPRLFPTADEVLNPQGVAFYREILTGLRCRGIAPVVTLYHWDLPSYLEASGGWAERATALAFSRYARACAEVFGDLVDTWTTLNEPWCSAFLGYASGVHAPGRCEPETALRAAHHLNLAHGLAVRALREALGARATVSVTLNLHVVRPADPADADCVAAADAIDLVGNEIWLGPLLRGEYPAELLRLTRGVTDWGFVQDGDLETAHAGVDVLGVNYYSPNTVRRRQEGAAPGGSGGHGAGSASPWVGCDDVEFLPPPPPLTAMGWGVDPSGLTDLLTSLAQRYPGLPLIVTENGAAYDDVPVAGRVHDAHRVAYLRDHVEAVGRALDAGADVRGYFLWSFLDNFEWAYGYSKRFGIVRVDYDTLTRTPKDSFAWYRQLVRSGSLPPVQAGGAESA
ncbi:glycoside hydrolase family 1 protein [Actinomyces oricola]|uniref:glycoside hydrolase family 1 protein n=1 Tax=Actinomyces oricola TaxID=206043 RepID=UPI000FFF26F1|nr:family 1 glycosylhydrolase [Actinomyces oricola]